MVLLFLINFLKFSQHILLLTREKSCVLYFRPSGRRAIRGAGDLRFKSLVDQIGRSVAMARHRWDISLERSCVTRRQNDKEMGPVNSLHAMA